MQRSRFGIVHTYWLLPCPQGGNREAAPCQPSDKGAIMLHIRPPTYVTSLLLLIPSVIITLRVLEARKKKIEEKKRTGKKRDRRAILKMSGFAGTCQATFLTTITRTRREMAERYGIDVQSEASQAEAGCAFLYLCPRDGPPQRDLHCHPSAKLSFQG